jgi:hypothetical protein
MLKAAEQALRQLRRPEEVAKARGKQIHEVLPYKKPEEPAEPQAEPNAVAEEVATSGEAEADASS